MSIEIGGVLGDAGIVTAKDDDRIAAGKWVPDSLRFKQNARLREIFLRRVKQYTGAALA